MRHSKILISIMMMLGISTMLIITSCGDTGTSTPTLKSLTYSTSAINAVVGTEISAITPTVVPDGATATYTVDPTLPAGLRLDESSGVISGTPTARHSSTPHIVRAEGTGDYTGAVMATITITVSPTSLTSLEYSTSTLNAAVEVKITDITPTLVPDGATAEYSISPTLPAGLKLNESSGIISGTPEAVYASTPHTVTAMGTGNYTGEMNADITIIVLPKIIQSTTIAGEEILKLYGTDKRYHYVAFTIQAKDGTSTLGRYKFGLKQGGITDVVMFLDEIQNGDGIYRIVNASKKKYNIGLHLGIWHRRLYIP